MCQSQSFISFPLFVGWEQLQRGGEFFEVLQGELHDISGGHL